MPEIDKALKDESRDVELRLQDVYKAKAANSLMDMCVGRAHSLKQFAKEVTTLGFKTKPDYKKLRQILQ